MKKKNNPLNPSKIEVQRQKYRNLVEKHPPSISPPQEKIFLQKPETITCHTPPVGEAEFLHIANFINRRRWEKDVLAGATQFRRLEAILQKDIGKFIFVEANNEEEGLLAISYAHGLLQEKKYSCFANIPYHYGDKAPEDYYDDDDLSGAEDEPEDQDELSFYLSRSDYLPLIGLEEISLYYGCHPNPFFPIENRAADGAAAGSFVPYWSVQHTSPVVIRLRETNFPIDESEIHALRHFENRPYVFLLHIVPSQESLSFDPIETDAMDEYGIYQDDAPHSPLINRLILDYTADFFSVTCSKEEREQYHSKVLASWLMDFHLTVSPEDALSSIAKEISKIDSEHPSEYMERTLRLMQHDDPKDEQVTMDRLRKLGLLDLRKSPVDEVSLEQLVGMDQVKKDLKSVVNSLKFCHLRKMKGQKCNAPHNVLLFLGAPGTAKTTAAKILGHMLREEGVLPRSRFISLSGSQLKAGYVGQTAPRIHRFFEDYDILLIDEAYSLTASNDGRMDTFSQEAMAQLAIELEDHAGDRIVIFAGYGGNQIAEKDNRMQDFLTANPGIRSRIGYIIQFNSYSPEEMLSIVHSMAKDRGFHMTHAMDSEILHYFELRSRDSAFGNGREARVFMETAERQLANRYAGAVAYTPKMDQITRKDIERTLFALRQRDHLENPLQRYGII
jgi:SpoVK/Ycf46/Vps4 family AAA+-type ATPase